jgi:hypothetical protein
MDIHDSIDMKLRAITIVITMETVATFLSSHPLSYTIPQALSSNIQATTFAGQFKLQRTIAWRFDPRSQSKYENGQLILYYHTELLLPYPE